ncbi:hypothetical protein ACFQ5N_08330 [Lutibacter holmesii]|uniref:Uncharacterized protein n=1 Tax=Lutibacter holmesii TaxID=1137985 RepID=A0ABW3WNV8_9FLAO
MKTFKIGNLILTKKGILIIALGFFCTGVLLGASILLSTKSESNLRILLFLILNIPIWIYLFPKIEREITRT